MAKGEDYRSLLVLTIPAQHGAWSIIAAAFLLGIATTGKFGLAGGLFLIVVVFAFAAQHTAAIYLKLTPKDRRRRSLRLFLTAYCTVSAVAGISLVLCYRLLALIPIGGIALFFLATSLALSRKRRDRTAEAQLFSVLGLSLVLPATAYSSAASFPYPTFGLWILAALFFGGSIFHVRYLVRNRKESCGPAIMRLKAGWPSLAYYSVTLAIVSALSTVNLLPPLAAVAILPAVAKAIWGVSRRRPGPTPIRTIGQVELGHTVLFVALAIMFALPHSGNGFGPGGKNPLSIRPIVK